MRNSFDEKYHDSIFAMTEFLVGFPRQTFSVKVPSTTLNYKGTKNGYTITLATPGIPRDKLKVEFTDMLSISVDGTVKDKCRLYDNMDLDKVQAEYKDGLLTITIPVKTITPKVIPIT